MKEIGQGTAYSQPLEDGEYWRKMIAQRERIKRIALLGAAAYSILFVILFIMSLISLVLAISIRADLSQLQADFAGQTNALATRIAETQQPNSLPDEVVAPSNPCTTTVRLTRTTLYTSPNIGSSSPLMLEPGTPVLVIGQAETDNNYWFQVYVNGQFGWMTVLSVVPPSNQCTVPTVQLN